MRPIHTKYLYLIYNTHSIFYTCNDFLVTQEKINQIFLEMLIIEFESHLFRGSCPKCYKLNESNQLKAFTVGQYLIYN